MTLHSKTCSTKHIERKPITLYEKTCLSVCRRRQCPIERDPLEIERGDPFSKETRKHRLGLCSTVKNSRFLQSAKEELTNTNFKPLTTEEVFQSSTFDTFTRRRAIEDQDTILELSGRIQELQNERNCMSDSKEFQDAESIRSGNSHVTSRPVSFPPHPIPEGMLSRSFGVPSRREGPPSIWDTHGISGNVFANPDASLSAPYPRELNQWSSSIEEPLHVRHHVVDLFFFPFR